MRCTWEIKITRLNGKQELYTVVRPREPVKDGHVVECQTRAEVIKIRIIEPGHFKKPEGGISLGSWTGVTAEEVA
jgi:hypothetical protein